MIRKPPLAEAQAALRKYVLLNNTFCWTRVSVPLPKFCEKLLPDAKFHWNRAIGCRVMAKKRFPTYRPSTILNFKIFHIWSSVAVIEFQISSKSDDFSMIWRFYGLAGMRHLEFSKFRVFTFWSQDPRWRISAMFDFRGPITGSL